MAEKFTVGVDEWQDKLDKHRNVLRQELIARQLAAHLPQPAHGVRVLDVGCGQGTQVVKLASLGYNVTGVDPEEKLLHEATKNADKYAANTRFFKGTLENIPEEVGKNFDVVCCHGVLMYLPQLRPAIAQLVSLACPGGIVSVATHNQASIAMRAGMMGDWQGAKDGFDATYYDGRTGVTGVRSDKPQEVFDALHDNGAELIAW